MSVKPVTMFTVVCDACGVSADDGGEFCAWADANGAEEIAQGAGFRLIDGQHYCDECVEVDERTDEWTPKRMEPTP